ncbi:unnamed protein product [Didymodactylos carnosus]|uniref:lysozyme n=1 Tax=Didymodactylos carnosus TaxID=1234261 RepID=A0A814XZ61_9BILA|nr:unnamed protein product [Didymodactylos carnosus]CAF3985778.1 unnamed protein product [Didymodactylos carnosus]
MNFVFVVFVLLISTCYGGIDQACLDCICEIESQCSAIGCSEDVGSLSCGYYQIKENYYIDCEEPGDDWQSCADDKSCADTCVENYLERYGTYCTGGSEPTCEDYARIHNGGPKGCQTEATTGYWERVQKCLDSKK